MQSPYVSVIMPIRNEEDYIERSLGAVLAQDFPHDQMEVLIADGMSGDDTRKIIQDMVIKTNVSVKIIDNPQQIVATGFNIALKQTQGEYIVRVDGHCEIATDYISQCIRHLAHTEIGGVGGPIETISENKIGEIIAVAMSSKFGVGGSAFRTLKNKETYVDTIAFPAYKRDIMNQAGLLDEELVRNQDDEYNYRIRSMGYKLLLTPKIKSKYYGRTSIVKLWRQYHEYGLYKVRVMQKHPRQMRPRQFVPFLLVSVLITTGILSLFVEKFQFIFLPALGSYFAANLIATIWTAYHSGLRHLLFLPVVYATLHFSYGFGFLHGLIKFRNRWSE